MKEWLLRWWLLVVVLLVLCAAAWRLSQSRAVRQPEVFPQFQARPAVTVWHLWYRTAGTGEWLECTSPFLSREQAEAVGRTTADMVRMRK